MSKDGEGSPQDLYYVPPVEDFTPEELEAIELTRRLAESTNSTANPPAAAAPKMTTEESLRKLLKMKEEHFELIYKKLHDSLQKEEKEPKLIEVQLRLLHNQLKEVNKSRSGIMKQLLQQDKSDAYKLEEGAQYALEERVMLIELEVEEVKPSHKSTPTTGRGPSDVDPLQEVRDMANKLYQLREGATVEVTSQLDSLHILTSTREIGRIPEQLDLVTIYWERYARLDEDFMGRLSQFAPPEHIHFQATKTCTLLQRKMELERKANDLIKENQSSLDATLPMSMNHPLLKNRKDLPKLASDVKEWLPFWSHFVEIDQSTLSDARKIQELLKATVEGSEARQIVHCYHGDPKLYSAARDHLKNMFGRPNVLIKVYVRELLQLGLNKAGGKPMEFRKLVTSITALIRNLEMLGLTANMSAQVLYPIVEMSLPKAVLTAWQHNPGYKDELDKLMAFLQEEVIYERERFHANLHVPKASTAKEGDKEKGKKSKSTPSTSAFYTEGESGGDRCTFCSKDHWAGKCEEAWKMTLQERVELLNNNGACAACLKKGHSVKDCTMGDKISCKRCQQSHRLIVCPAPKPKSKTGKGKKTTSTNLTRAEPEEEDPSDVEQDPPVQVQSTSSSYNNFVDDAEVPLQIIPLVVTGADGRTKTVRALLDTGSQKSYITAALQEELQFEKMGEEYLTHQLFGGISTSRQRHQKVMLHASGVKTAAPAHFQVWCIQTISGRLEPPPEGNYLIEFRRKGVEFLQQINSDPVEVLIGNDVVPRLYTGRIVDLGTGPVAMQTRWGWVLCGKIPHIQLPQPIRDSTRTMTVTHSLLNLPLSALWELDSLGIQDEAATQSKEELAALTQQHFDDTVSRTEDGRYRVALPFISGSSSLLPTNYFGAEKRLKATTDKLRKEGYLQQYNQLFIQWEQDGMIEKIVNSTTEVGHYLPHRAGSSTTPIRPVFDASAKPRGKPSLNDCLEKGPNYLELIPALLTRFRLGKIGVTADIRKAFQQIEVAPEHRDFLRFLWWTDETCKEIKVFRHTRVVFGVTSSPFLLAATLKHHLKEVSPSRAQTSKMLLGSLYVDNVAHSLSTETELSDFISQSKELLEPAHFDLRGWEHGPDPDGKETPLLGLTWDTKGDMLSLDLKDVMELVSIEMVKTPRSLLSVVQMLYDPLGLVSPFSIMSKMILRKVHECKLGWDGELPVELQNEFRKWNRQIQLLSEFSVPRYIGWEEMNNRSLHIFSDASGEAFATAAFIRGETAEGVKVSLLQSKAKLSPKKATIPRLELLGCLIGSRLAQTILEDIRCPQLPVTFWTDSTTAVSWITGEGPWATFVNNRVQEIRKNSTSLQWRHCPGKVNPADLPSRGCSAKKLLESKWWEGPSWLYLPETDWPRTMGEISEEEVSKEKRKTVSVNMTLVPNHPMEEFLRISDYPRIVSAVAKWMRVKNNLIQRVNRKQNANLIAIAVPISTTEEELQRAENIILRHIQRGLLNEPNRISKLRPFMEDGIIRTKTRLLQGEEVDINPIILPDRNEFSNRIIRHLHEESCHVGTQLLLSVVREKYWLLNGRRTVRTVIKSCWICRRYNTRKLEVEEPPLPKTRTGTGSPFHVTGVDMAGPLILRDRKKVWIALFTCASYRAIHLEVVSSMSTDEFFVAFRRFVARRGKPAIVYSDNGLNFTGAGAAIRNLYEKNVRKFANEKRLDWRFICPLAPFWGGFYERLIGLTKQLLRKTLGHRCVHQKELEVLLLEVEETLNNRPLTYLPEDPDDPVPLTPNMMVRNSGLAYVPELDVRDAASARAAHRRIQKLREGLRSRFRKEYLGQLKFERTKRTNIKLKPGDVVLVEEPKKRQEWPLAVVIEAVNIGRDGVERKFRLKTKSGVITRAAQLLYPMELAEEDPAQQQG